MEPPILDHRRRDLYMEGGGRLLQRAAPPCPQKEGKEELLHSYRDSLIRVWDC